MGISGDSMGFNGDFPGDFIPDLDLESRKPSTWGINVGYQCGITIVYPVYPTTIYMECMYVCIHIYIYICR